MRWLLLTLCLVLPAAAHAGEGRVYKVLPQYLDEKGRQSLTPSLYDRDAYQALLRRNPAKRTALQFAVQWKATKSEHLKLRVEMRGVSPGGEPQQTTLELPVQQQYWFSHWAALTLDGEAYKKFGELSAWRATLWDGEQLLGEQNPSSGRLSPLNPPRPPRDGPCPASSTPARNIPAPRCNAPSG